MAEFPGHVQPLDLSSQPRWRLANGLHSVV